MLAVLILSDTSKRLSHGDEILRSFESRNRIQIPPDVKANGSDRGVEADTNPDRVGIIVFELAERDVAVNIPAIVKNHPS